MKNILCYIFGHSFISIFEWKNDRSLFCTLHCSRCGKDEDKQYDLP